MVVPDVHTLLRATFSIFPILPPFISPALLYSQHANEEGKVSSKKKKEEIKKGASTMAHNKERLPGKSTG